MTLATTLQSHWIKVLAGVIPHGQAPVEVTIVQDSIPQTLRVIPLRRRSAPENDGTYDTVESVHVFMLKNPNATYAPTSVFVGGMMYLKIGSLMHYDGKRYTHTGELTDDSDAYMVAVFERRFRSIQGRGR